jgi:CRP-like cAMP-binding protein
MDRAEAEQRILERGWLSEQPEDIRSAVLQRARLVKHERGHVVFNAGDERGGICGVVSGGIGIYLPTGEGDLKLAHVGRSGIWFGYGPLIRGRRRSLSFSPTETTWLMHLALPVLQEIAGTSPVYQRAILSVSEFGMDAAIMIIENLMIQSHARRIAATLLRVAPPGGEGGACAPLEVMLSQSQLGELASVGRQVVNRELQRLEARGWIKSSYTRVSVLDRDALTAFALGR